MPFTTDYEIAYQELFEVIKKRKEKEQQIQISDPEPLMLLKISQDLIY